MNTNTLVKALKVSAGIIGLLTVVLCVHIYQVTRPGKVSAQTVAMARIDFKQDINQTDANEINKWLSAQQGVVHTLCNPETDISVFSYRPIQSDPDQLVQELSNQLNYAAVRYVPDANALKSGCPMKSTSMITRIVSIF